MYLHVAARPLPAGRIEAYRQASCRMGGLVVVPHVAGSYNAYGGRQHSLETHKAVHYSCNERNSSTWPVPSATFKC
jgi:hypothetical protein